MVGLVPNVEWRKILFWERVQLGMDQLSQRSIAVEKIKEQWITFSLLMEGEEARMSQPESAASVGEGEDGEIQETS